MTYESKLDTFDPMLFEAYKEAELQQMRADCAEAELEYYKACNDPNGFHGPQLRQMHERLLELKTNGRCCSTRTRRPAV